ncbi:hypothetical protein GWI33_016616 [Rhynchophorus ferrugineus]|uniref:Uncharacterized protein n=1 Tax=Rhynchophorus ferrugineus TaxID=354439 RepID=A0A834M6Y4_RHYFE|nr:hypothetical protein GWI33_016616 [Rhynchophorus ferrugineus]
MYLEIKFRKTNGEYMRFFLLLIMVVGSDGEKTHFLIDFPATVKQTRHRERSSTTSPRSRSSARKPSLSVSLRLRGGLLGDRRPRNLLIDAVAPPPSGGRRPISRRRDAPTAAASN